LLGIKNEKREMDDVKKTKKPSEDGHGEG